MAFSRSIFVGLALALSLAATLAFAQPAGTERITLVVEVLERDSRPIIPCGMIGAQPRHVRARVIAVEEGTFGEPTIELSWPMCEFSQVQPGERHRIRVRRRADTPAGATYRVRWSQHVTP
jgi:hypothetical protein